MNRRRLVRLSLPALAALTLPLLAQAPPAGPSEEEKQIGLIREAIADGNLEEASARGEKAMAASPKSSRLKTWTARAYAARAVEAQDVARVHYGHRADTLFLEAISLDPANVEARLDLLTLLLRGAGLRGRDVPAAEKQAGEIFRIDPALGHVARGLLLEDGSKLDAAGAEYRAAFALRPGVARVYVPLVDFEARSGRYEAATEVCAKAQKATSDLLPTYLMARLAYQFSRDLEKALDWLDAFLARPPALESPSHADAHWRKGKILEKLGRVPAAKAEYEAALALVPGHRESERELARLTAP
ncbi:MAG: hypothetical protein EDX89_01045 [Acidobacteria bacterium]|nr:MAG: hypothetical protein EDX89_01045 [Acidobacteriota bacterium]MCE7960822.1 hypothetical protein [Acidobacteria bacterium ACB2]